MALGLLNGHDALLNVESCFIYFCTEIIHRWQQLKSMRTSASDSKTLSHQNTTVVYPALTKCKKKWLNNLYYTYLFYMPTEVWSSKETARREISAQIILCPFQALKDAKRCHQFSKKKDTDWRYYNSYCIVRRRHV